jgi:tetratricopeptide (TPR) repeat protein
MSAEDCVPSHLSESETLARFQQLDQSALAAMDAGQYAAAVRQYREAACLVPKSARAFYGLGMAEAAGQNFAAARTALEMAYSIVPGNAMPLAMLVRVNVASKDTEQVRTVLRTAATRFPNDAELHAGLARFLAENQLLDLALAELLRSEQAGANDPASAIALGALENAVGAYGDAIRIADSVVKQSNLSASVRASAAGVAGLSYEAAGLRDEAIRLLRLAISLAPAQENSYLALAYIYQKAQQFKQAGEILAEGRKQVPKTDGFLLPLGNNLVWSQQYRGGIAILKELIGKEPRTEEAYIRLAEAYHSTDQTDLEINALRSLLRVQPDYPMIHVLIAQAMLRLTDVDYPGALAELAEAEKRAPNDAGIFYLRGKAYLGMNRNEDAIAALKRAIEIAPLDDTPYNQLGLAYRRLGRLDLAREALERMELIKQASKP